MRAGEDVNENCVADSKQKTKKKKTPKIELKVWFCVRMRKSPHVQAAQQAPQTSRQKSKETNTKHKTKKEKKKQVEEQ